MKSPMVVLRPLFRTVLAAFAALTCTLVTAASVWPVGGENGMVVTAQHLATKVGVDVLKRGGNAVDAAVAVGYALAVVYPGGRQPRRRRLHDHPARRRPQDLPRLPREGAARRDAPTCTSTTPATSSRARAPTGHLAVGVPGTVAGPRIRAREVRHDEARGTLIAPAIALAERGFVLDAGRRRRCSRPRPTTSKDDPATAAIFLNNGQPYEAGDGWCRRTSRRRCAQIARAGRRRLLQGPGRRRDRRVEPGRQGHHHARPTSTQYKTRELAPVECDYRGYHVVSAPPPSSGGVIICEILNILEGYPLKDLGFRSAQAVHYQIEAMRHAYVDRNSYLGDPDFVKNPLDRLLDKDYAAKIRAAIDPNKAGVSTRPEARRRRRTKAATRRTTRSSTARATRSRSPTR